jgi:NitT/TauT family transport system ATP-binding protein
MSNTEPKAAPAAIRSEGPRALRAGFIPLVDASVLIAAAELGFAGREGLSLALIRDVSWANVRDRLAFRQFDIAHMLSPMPVAATLGLGSNPSPTITPFALGRGGNAITLSARLFERMQAVAGVADLASALENARALAQVLAQMRAAGEAPPTFGVTYPFSSHNYEFRYWLAAGGIDPDRDVRLVVVPPPLTSDALAAGEIDGFCVGAPWNMVASELGVGRIVAVKQDIWPDAPEKVIGLRPDWAAEHPETLSRLIVALDAAARWCDQPENHDALADLLAQPRLLGAPMPIIRHVLSGEFCLDAKGNRRVLPDYFVFHRAQANYPDPDLARWIYSQMIRWGQAGYSPEQAAAAAASSRPDLYCEALGIAPPAPGGEVMGPFIDGLSFDPRDIPGYVEAFGVRSLRASGGDD